MTAPRLLAIMGSGETSPTMAPVHRAILARLVPRPVPAVMLDTPAAFQDNVGALGARVAEYFARRLQQDLTVLAIGGDVPRPGVTDATALARLAEARYVFAGPGSPSFALQEWRRSAVPGLLAQKLATGGAVVFASAAALTLGVVTLPVYEIYKVGQPPHWLDGLNLMAGTGLSAAVLPHFDNADGGDHDTRYCFVGERRLAALESLLSPDTFVLGIDEHTAAVFDLESGTVEVLGRGRLTVRAAGRAETFVAPTTVAIATLADAARRLAGGSASPARSAGPADPHQAAPVAAVDRGPAEPWAAPDLEAEFQAAQDRQDWAAAVGAALRLEAHLRAEGEAPPEALALASGYLRAMLVRLGEAAAASHVDRRVVLASLVEAVLNARRQAREAQRWAVADALRDALTAGGVTVTDTSVGVEWDLAEPASSPAG